MLRKLLALIVCLLALGPQRVCACEAVPCHDAHESTEHDDSEPAHSHHEPDCPALTAAPATALPAATVVIEPPATSSAILEIANVALPPTLLRSDDHLDTGPPHVPLHVSLQVFRN